MRINEILAESLNDPYPYEYKVMPPADDYDALHMAHAQLPDGSEMVMGFHYVKGGNAMRRMPNGEMGLYKSPGTWEIGFSRDGSEDVSGKGDQYKVFATIKAATLEFLQRVNPAQIKFHAKSEHGTGRLALYRRFAKMLSSLGYKLEEHPLTGNVTFILRKDQATN